MFGHPIILNFNKEDSTKKTFIGGFLSLCIRIAILIYVSLKLKRLILLENPNTSSEEFLIKHEDSEGQSVSWEELKLIFTPSLQRVRHKYLGKFKFNNETLRYIDL